MTEPTPISDLLGDVLARFGVARPEDSIALLERWRELAPPPWAERANPVALRDGTLEVEVADGTTASLLKYQQARLVSSLVDSLGAGLVDQVKITVIRHRSRSGERE